MSLWGNGNVIFHRMMAKGILLTNHSLLTLSPASGPVSAQEYSQNSSQSQPAKTWVRPHCCPAHNLQGPPPHSESRPESCSKGPNALCPPPETLFPRCPPGSFHLLSGALSLPGAQWPHACTHLPTASCSTPASFIFSTSPYCPLSYYIIHLLIVLLLCPLHKGRDFCLFCSLMTPRMIVEIFNFGHHQGSSRHWPGCCPCWCFPGEYQPWMHPQHLPQSKHLFNKYFLNEWINSASVITEGVTKFRTFVFLWKKKKMSNSSLCWRAFIRTLLWDKEQMFVWYETFSWSWPASVQCIWKMIPFIG